MLVRVAVRDGDLAEVRLYTSSGERAPEVPVPAFTITWPDTGPELEPAPELVPSPRHRRPGRFGAWVRRVVLPVLAVLAGAVGIAVGVIAVDPMRYPRCPHVPEPVAMLCELDPDWPV